MVNVSTRASPSRSAADAASGDARPLCTRITVDGDTVTWSRFRQPHRPSEQGGADLHIRALGTARDSEKGPGGGGVDPLHLGQGLRTKLTSNAPKAFWYPPTWM